MFKRLLSTSSICKNVDKYALYVPTSGVFPKGFQVGSTATGVKKNGSLDLGVIVNTAEQCNAAAVFTTNKFKAAPVIKSAEVIAANRGQNINAIVVNSGCANSVTGDVGFSDAVTMTDKVNQHLGQRDSTLVMSTGVIGQRLQIAKIASGIDTVFAKELGSSYEHWLGLAKSICTTDTFPKMVTSHVTINGTEYTMTGIAKGAGMICPNMATLLGFIVTDMPIEAGALSALLRGASDRSFNCISVDGDMSTNDTICMLANGAAGGETITETSPAFAQVQEQVTDFAQQLAQLVVRDGEGATKFITVDVANASSFKDAKTIAESISNSMLVKTALYGKDANWGRILCAIGYAKLENLESLNVDTLNVKFVATDGSKPDLELIKNGVPELDIDESRASEILALTDLRIEVDLGTGQEQCQFWTCDLSHEYVTINGDYRS